MPQFSQWTRPQRRGLLFLVLVFVVGHLLLFHANQEQQHTTLLRPLPTDLVAKRDSLRQLSLNKDTIYPFNPNRLTAWHAYRLDLPKSLVDTIQSRVAQATTRVGANLQNRSQAFLFHRHSYPKVLC